MPRPFGPVFRPAAVRDALRPVRGLWLVEREGSDVTRPAHVTESGRTLVERLELGRDRRSHPDTLGYRAAGSRSADAGDNPAVMPWPGDLAEVGRVAEGRVNGAQVRNEDARGAKQAAVARRV